MKIAAQKLMFFLLYLQQKKYKTDILPPEQPRKILLVMCKWIGDTFWDLQGIPALQKKFPNAEIHVLTKPFSKFLFQGILPEENIHLTSHVISDCRRESFDKSQWKKDLQKMKQLEPELLIDFTETPFSAVFSALTGAKHRIGYDHLGRFSQLYTYRCHAEYGIHLSRRPMQLYTPLINKELPFPQIVPQVFNPVSTGIDVMIFPGVGWKAKEYPAEKYRRIAEALSEKGYSICVSGSPKELALCETIANGVKNATVLTGSQEEMLRHLRSAKVCLSGDTGPAHLAAAMGVATVAIFCGTNPEFCGPLGQNVVILRSGCPECPRGKTQFCSVDRTAACQKNCFMDVPEEKVLKVLVEALNG
ncbi:MAG: glycosyltransferase family 9 protein [Lentisphaerae bacterium]|nr:glycosyltransferase family 9 protein [Lentisphaerota bacterium]